MALDGENKHREIQREMTYCKGPWWDLKQDLVDAWLHGTNSCRQAPGTHHVLQSCFAQQNAKTWSCSLGCVYFWHVRCCCQHEQVCFTGWMTTWHRWMTVVWWRPLYWRPLLPTVGGWLCGPWHGKQLKIAKENKQAAAIACFLPVIDKDTHKQPHTALYHGVILQISSWRPGVKQFVGPSSTLTFSE